MTSMTSSMTTLPQLARKLRLVADALDDLLGTYVSIRQSVGLNETPATAAKIRQSFTRSAQPKRRPRLATTKQTAKKSLKQPPSQKGKKYAPGTHWTQKPGGRERMRRIQEERYAKMKSADMGTSIMMPHHDSAASGHEEHLS